ncbi:MAG: hypothetical protein KME30_28840 [Iphinoe sp. HA4291-MV1]|nr:hypothetical protein [Iphinoe sp. HA4291-MV1]
MRNSCLRLNRLIKSLLKENKLLKQQLEKAYINSNFGCYNRAGAQAKGNEFLQKERHGDLTRKKIWQPCF